MAGTAKVKCAQCGKEEVIYQSRLKKYKTCSVKCLSLYLSKEPNTECVVCGKKLSMKPHRLKRVKHGLTCSKQCFIERQKVEMLGEKNHRKGMVGDLSQNFKEGLIKHSGYYHVFVPNHPRSSPHGRVRVHRWLVEQNSHLYNHDYFEIINDYLVLKQMFDVHHIDGNKKNNELKNLMVLTRSEHSKLHGEIRRRLKLNKKANDVVETVRDGGFGHTGS